MLPEMNAVLLVDGKEAFDEILNCIHRAQSSVLINMFIWRDDEIGREIAAAVLKAADRGVKVSISMDRMGFVLEMCEECERSFFHKAPSFFESAKIGLLRKCYPENCARVKRESPSHGLLESMLSHPNITVERDAKKNDHSKFYIFDDRILIFGGINIEEKERSRDCAGRVYQDYMLKMEGEEYVNAFYDKLHGNERPTSGYRFRMNNKTVSPAEFEMRKSVLSIINGANRELVIVMAYFSTVPSIMSALIRAWKRGVHIRILIPGRANFEDDSNKRCMHTLLKRTGNGIKVYLSPKMVHAKVIYNENTVMFGSSNITNRAFRQLGETDIELENTDCSVIRRLKETVEENFAAAQRIENCSQLRFSAWRALLEGLLN